MFADPANTSPLGPALLTSIGAVIVAGIAGGFAWLSNSKSNRNTADLQEYKSATDRDLERLKTKLAHGQLISSTQWNAEFSAYQALWKSIVPVRALANKIVMREGELTVLGLETGDVSEADKIENIKRLLEQYTVALGDCILAINEHAPFYPAGIRVRGNEVHGLGHTIFKTNLAALVARMKGKALPADQAVAAENERRRELKALMGGVDSLEEMIRLRLANVQVINSAIG